MTMNVISFLLMIIVGVVEGFETLPLKIQIIQECYLENMSSLQKSNEQNIYRINIENEKTLLGETPVKEIVLIADGKQYLIKNNEAHAYNYKDATKKYAGNYRIYGEDLQMIMEAQNVYAVILYKKIVTEENEHNPLSLYENKIQTTVIKKSYFPVIIDKKNVQIEFLACTSAIKGQKDRKIKFETILVSSLIGVIIVVLYIFWRRKQKNRTI